jgi:hypothetical protein
MAITASGLYGLTLEKFFLGTAGASLEDEDNKLLLVQDAHTPDFDAHDFRDDITNEVSGGGYTAGGKAYTSTEVTLSGGTLTYDAADTAWTSSTITDAMAAVGYADVGTAGTDQLFFLSDFVTAVSTSSGTLTVAWNASGIFTVDYTP